EFGVATGLVAHHRQPRADDGVVDNHGVHDRNLSDERGSAAGAGWVGAGAQPGPLRPTQVVESLPGDAAKCLGSGLGRGGATAAAGLVVAAAGVTLIQRRPATEPSVGATRREPGLLVE
ncbi:MAG TPA: hypothetical protein VKB37_12115, partial [Jatrophihabitantaceae bacterium]|nr:hypothetical protein [Jatrophihabitantaceae bacterium]